MLALILRRYLKPYGLLIAGVVVFQLAQAVASLFLPALNAAIIDRGIATGDTAYILQIGGVMLAITLVQIACAITAVYFGARRGDGARARPARGGLRPRRHVL